MNVNSNMWSPALFKVFTLYAVSQCYNVRHLISQKLYGIRAYTLNFNFHFDRMLLSGSAFRQKKNTRLKIFFKI